MKNSLTDFERFRIAQLFCPDNGYVVGFRDKTFGNFFGKFGINIQGDRYQKYGSSKGKKFRAFLDLESDHLIAGVTSRLIDHYIVHCEKWGQDIDKKRVAEVRQIIDNLVERPERRTATIMNDVPDVELRDHNIEKLPIDPRIIPVVKARLKEAKIAQDSGAYLAVVFLCGSILEGVLLGVALKFPKRFNKATAAPKHKNGSPKKFYEWSLAGLIDVAREIKLLPPDVKGWSHELRHFRNYIHPFQQMSEQFTPNKRTAQLCFITLASAFESIAKYSQ